MRLRRSRQQAARREAAMRSLREKWLKSKATASAIHKDEYTACLLNGLRISVKSTGK
jgi:hypothetical protein